jgi:hypothetical protein
LCLLSLANIGAGFGLATVLGQRYRKIAARRLWASLTASLPVVPAPVTAVSVAPVAPAPTPIAAPVAVEAALPEPKSPGHLAIDDLQNHVAGFNAKLMEADERLRQCAASPDLGTIETVLNDIESSARNFAESRESH